MPILILVLASFFSQTASAKMSPQLSQQLQTQGRADALVYFGEGADFSSIPENLPKADKGRRVYEILLKDAQTKQRHALSFLKREGASFQSFHIVNAVLVRQASTKLLQRLAAFEQVSALRPNTRFVERLPRVELPALDLGSSAEVPQNLSSIGIERVWNELKIKGDGVVIAGQDGGFAWKHPALQRQYRGYMGISANHNYSWHDSIHGRASSESSACRPDSPEPCDDTGHGTHTMGTMVGDDGGANRIGVAPNAKWIGCRNMQRGVGTAATYLECFEFFLAPYPIGGDPKQEGVPELAPHVVNNSWACPPNEGCKGDEFLGAIRALHAAGILVVVAAGNEGPACGTLGNPPGYYAGEVLAVAANDHRNGQIADFSSRGPSAWNGGVGINLTAPGNLVRSAIPAGDGWTDGPYDHKSGTSMASPHIAGVVALLWQARPELIGKISETIRRLEKTADPKTSGQSCGKFPGSQIPNAVFGYGIVNAWRAIQAE